MCPEFSQGQEQTLVVHNFCFDISVTQRIGNVVSAEESQLLTFEYVAVLTYEAQQHIKNVKIGENSMAGKMLRQNMLM